MARPSPQSQVALVSALVVTLIGAGLVAVLVAGLLDGVRGVGPLLLAALAIGVFALAGRLFLVSRSIRTRAPGPPPHRPPAPGADGAPRPRPGPRHRRTSGDAHG